MGSILRKIEESSIDRSTFLAAGPTALAALALAGCSQESSEENTVSETVDTAQAAVFVDAELDPDGDGKWVPVSCEWNCGGHCIIKAYVTDGIVTRVKTDDSHEDSVEYPQVRACVRGRAQKQMCFGADRLKYPMKRKHWEPGTGGQKELRGIDEWERISWDEAYDYIVAEVKRIVENYGSGAIFEKSTCEIEPFFTMLGGATTVSDTASFGTTAFTATRIGFPPFYIKEGNDRFDLKNSDMILLHACNPAWASATNQMWNFLDAKSKGTKFAFIGPEYNVTASALDAKWIRVRPGTDIAFLLAVAYLMFTNDNNGSIIDWEFLEKYTVGIDGDHMPADAKVNENFKDYVLGAYDGQPKTPEWATEICGTPIEDIEWYADQVAKDKTTAMLYSYAASRCHHSEDWLQLFMTIGCMGGHMGKPGHACGTVYHTHAGKCGPDLSNFGPTGLSTVGTVEDSLAIDIPGIINANQLWDAVINHKYLYTGNSLGDVFDPGEEREANIHMIVHHGTGVLLTASDVNKAIEAHRTVDFVLACGWVLRPECAYADIVLPVATMWERVGDMRQEIMVSDRDREIVNVHLPVCEPLFESKDPWQVCLDLCERYGMDPKQAYPISQEQVLYNRLAGTTAINKEGTEFETLLTITQEDIDAMGVEGTPQEGRIPLAKFLEDGVYSAERYEGDPYGYLGYQDFINDPEGSPRNTPSGKFEIYSQTKADVINALGYSGPEEVWKPYPTYKRPLDGYEDSFSDWEGKVKGEYPYQVYNPHYLRRQHTQSDHLPYLREALVNPVFINAQDAAEKGVKQGDTVLVYNQFGKILRPASVTERLMPGCIGVPHGAWVDMDENGIDHAGTDNVLRGGERTAGCGVSGYNTVLVNFEKWTGDELVPDAELPLRTVDLD